MADWDRMFRASWGGLPLNVLRGDDELNEVLAKHRYPHVDGANSENLGEDRRETECEIVFFGEGHLAALDEFVRLKRQHRPQTFVHPLTGQYQAEVERFRFSWEASTRDWIQVSCTFVEATTEVAVFEVSDSRDAFAGREDVEQSAFDADTALSDLGKSTSLTSRAIETATTWSEIDLTANQIEVQLGELADRLQDEIEALDILGDVDGYLAVIAMQSLFASLRRAADAAIADSPRLATTTVDGDSGLLAVLSGLYGASEALDRFDRILRLNRIKNPAVIPSGTVLVIEAD